MKVSKTWRYVELNCGDAIEALNSSRDQLDGIASAVEVDELEERDGFIADFSHCVMTNIPNEDDLYSDLIGDILAERILQLYPVIDLPSDK